MEGADVESLMREQDDFLFKRSTAPIKENNGRFTFKWRYIYLNNLYGITPSSPRIRFIWLQQSPPINFFLSVRDYNITARFDLKNVLKRSH